MRILPGLIILSGPLAGAAVGLYLFEPQLKVGADQTLPAPTGFDALSVEAAREIEPEVETEQRSYVKIGRQIIIPIVEDRETRALMLFELALDLPATEAERAHALEPRLRDAFLEVLFRMSSAGSFSGSYTDPVVIEALRRELVRAARRFFGPTLQDVLILDVIRQEV